MTKIDVYGLDGKKASQMELPGFFDLELRDDLIKRAVLSDLSQAYQPKGTYEYAGLDTSADYKGRKDTYGTIKNKGISRLPREVQPHGRFGKVRIVPFSKGGRRAHPPKIEKILAEKMNKKEYLKALGHALAAATDAKIVSSRGHSIPEGIKLPLAVVNEVESITKTKDAIRLLVSLGLVNDLKKSARGKKKTGVQRRVGATKFPKSALVVFAGDCKALKAFSNIPGIDAIEAGKLKVSDLAPGTHPGRLLVIAQNAFETLAKRLS